MCHESKESEEIMNTVLNVNESRMQQLPKANITSYALTLYFALRERHTESFNVRVLKNELLRTGVPVKDKDLYSAMEQLQKEGLGSIVYGKNGSDDHFRWGYNINQFNRKFFDTKTLSPILALAPKERKAAFVESVKEFSPEKRGVGRPKSVLKMEAKRPVGRPKGSKNTTKAPEITFDKRILAIPLKGNRDIKIEIPSDLNKDEVALLSLTISEIIG